MYSPLVGLQEMGNVLVSAGRDLYFAAATSGPEMKNTPIWRYIAENGPKSIFEGYALPDNPGCNSSLLAATHDAQQHQATNRKSMLCWHGMLAMATASSTVEQSPIH